MKRTLKLATLAPVGAATVALAAYAAEPPTQSGETQMPPEMAAKLAMAQGGGAGGGADDLPKFEDVAKDFTKVISTTDGEPSLYTIYTRQKDSQMLAELPRNFESQKLFIAYTISGGCVTRWCQACTL